MRPKPRSGTRRQGPELLEQHGLLDGSLGKKPGDDVWLGELAGIVFRSSRAEAAQAIAAALGAGYDPNSVGEALSIASTRLLLHDGGRASDASFGRDRGSVHGASVGVHASDSAQAWRAIAAVSSPRNAAASLIVGAYHTAGQTGHVGMRPFPYAERAAESDGKASPEELLDRLDASIRGRDQGRACALAAAYVGREGADLTAYFDRMIRFAVSEDGALHAEKYFRTVQSAVATGRAAFRSEHLLALARVTASECGTPAPGGEQARKLIGA